MWEPSGRARRTDRDPDPHGYRALGVPGAGLIRPVDAHDRIARSATEYRHRLRKTILPYWLEISRDDTYGGYLVADDFQRSRARRVARRVLRRQEGATPYKHLVAHARLVWVFSFAHRKGYDTSGEFLTAAERGYRFLLDHFLDRDRGGFCWTTDRQGTPVDDAKSLYGQAFIVYGFVEYGRAQGDDDAVRQALSVHQVVNDHLHDAENQGWREHAAADWSALPDHDRRFGIDVIGRKSGDANLHWMEALTELYEETGDDGVRRSLIEVLDASRRHLFGADPGQTPAYCFPDWAPDTAHTNLWRYGHNVEFAWLMIQADLALGRDPSWTQFFDYLDHALGHGFDHRRGGVYRSDVVERLAKNTDKVFWVQAEMVAALTDGLMQRDEPRYATALAQLLTFVERHQMDRSDGIWLQSVTERGRRLAPRKAGEWKVGYHEVRALVKLVDAFAPTPRAWEP